MFLVEVVVRKALFAIFFVLTNFAALDTLAAAAYVSVASFADFRAVEVACSAVSAQIDEFFTRATPFNTAFNALVLHQLISVDAVVALYVSQVDRASATILAALIVRI